MFMRGREHDINVERAFLHMAADAAVSGGVVISAIVIMSTGWVWVDPVAGLLVSAVIAWSAFGLMKSALQRMLAPELNVHLGRQSLAPFAEPSATPASPPEASKNR